MPGLGDFTCCARGHRFEKKDAKTGEVVGHYETKCDRGKVGKMIEILIDKKLGLLQNAVSLERSESSNPLQSQDNSRN